MYRGRHRHRFRSLGEKTAGSFRCAKISRGSIMPRIWPYTWRKSFGKTISMPTNWMPWPVGKGPGSYTGLRIAVSLAKGICYATGKPLIAVNSLEALVQVALEDFEAGILDPGIVGRRQVAADDRRETHGSLLSVVRCAGPAVVRSGGSRSDGRKLRCRTGARTAGAVRQRRGQEAKRSSPSRGGALCRCDALGSRSGKAGRQRL